MVIAIIRFGSGHPNVCIICEYDALPGIGHACGHNLIAEAGVAAGLGVKAFIESQGTGYTGKVTVMGTPAEEGGGGKVLMIEKGAFEGVDIAIMAHPCPFESVVCIANARMILKIDYHGKAAHAAAFPWEGVNALDAAVMAYTSISALRQQMKPSWRVHGVFTNGGVKPNIIPEKASLQYYIRAPTLEELEVLREKVMACFNGVAKATGCSVEVSIPAPTYKNILSNLTLANLYAKHLKSQDIEEFMFERELNWSTDMGNVSHVVPSLHPTYWIGDAVNHTHKFTGISNTTEAHDKTLLIGKVMALTCIDVLKGGMDIVREISEQFNSTKKQ